jgi:uncharacterized protein YoxC
MMNIKDIRQIFIGSIAGALVVTLVVVAGCNILDTSKRKDNLLKSPSKSIKALQNEQNEICNQQKKILDKLKNIEEKVNHGKR